MYFKNIFINIFIQKYIFPCSFLSKSFIFNNELALSQYDLTPERLKVKFLAKPPLNRKTFFLPSNAKPLTISPHLLEKSVKTGTRRGNTIKSQLQCNYCFPPCQRKTRKHSQKPLKTLIENIKLFSS